MRTGDDQVRVPPSAGFQKDLCRRTPQRLEGNLPVWKGEGDLPAGLFGKRFSPREPRSPRAIGIRFSNVRVFGQSQAVITNTYNTRFSLRWKTSSLQLHN